MKEKLNMVFSEFLNSIRIEKAKNLIVFNENNITEIAYECGFGSLRNFNRVFLRNVGCSPSEYRKSIKNTN